MPSIKTWISSFTILASVSLTIQQDVRSYGGYLRKTSSQLSSIGNYTFDLTPSVSYGSGVNQIVGLAFGNDQDQVNVGAAQLQQRIGYRFFEYIQRNYIQVVFNQQSSGQRSARLELNYVQNGESKLIQSSLNFIEVPVIPMPPPDQENSNSDEEPPIPDLNNQNDTNSDTQGTTNNSTNSTVDNSDQNQIPDTHDTVDPHGDHSGDGGSADPIPGDNDFPSDMGDMDMHDMHHRRLQSGAIDSIYGAPIQFKLVVTTDCIMIVYNNFGDDKVLFNSTDYQAANSQTSNFNVSDLVSAVSTQKAWPYLATWQDNISSSEADLSFTVNKFTFQDSISYYEDLFTATTWASQTLTQAPFFLQKNTNVGFLAGNALFSGSGLNLAVRENSLSSNNDQWDTSSDLMLSTKVLNQDQTSGAMNLDVSFDSNRSQVRGPALLLNNLDLIQANSLYTLESCISFTDPIMDEVTGQPRSEQVSVYLRQKRYPFKALTKKETIIGLGLQTCNSVTLSTLDNLLFLNIKDYAQLVFDFTDYRGQYASGFRVLLQNLKLTSKPKPPPSTFGNSNPQIQYNDTVKITYVEEGWAAKNTSVNAGFGIVVCILIICFLFLIYIFTTNLKRIKAQRSRVELMKKEMDKLNRQISDQANLLRIGGTLAPTPHQNAAHQRMGTTGADRTRGTMFEGGTSPENFNEGNNNNQQSKNHDDLEMGVVKSPKRAGRQPEKSAAKADQVSKAYTSNKDDPKKFHNIKESPMVIEPNSNMNSPTNQFEYEYHSAEKGGAGAAIETSMQSYSRHIARHLGSGAIKKEKDTRNDAHSDDESFEKDDIQTNTNRNPDQHHFDNIDQISEEGQLA